MPSGNVYTSVPKHPYNRFGYPEVLPTNIRQAVSEQALGAEAFAQTMDQQVVSPQPQPQQMQIPKMQIPQIRMPQVQMPNLTKEQMMMAGAATIPLTYGANALMSGGDERWDRTAENTVGNLAGGATGAYAGYRYAGLPGAIVGGVAGALGGSYLSDRIADAFDPTMGMNNETLAMQAEERKQAALSLLNQYLDPRAQVSLQRRLMENQMAMS